LTGEVQRVIELGTSCGTRSQATRWTDDGNLQKPLPTYMVGHKTISQSNFHDVC